MAEARMYHSTALVLPDGRVVTAGGEAAGIRRAQIYSPPYLFKGPRPSITSHPSSTGYGAGFTVGTDSTDIAKVALLRPSGVTHAIDMNQRYVPLTFTKSGTTLNVTAPPSANHAPPGWYMLIATNSQGVPSAAGGSASAAARPRPCRPRRRAPPRPRPHGHPDQRRRAADGQLHRHVDGRPDELVVGLPERRHHRQHRA